ncbi:hypothetical protein B0H14DRAFT_2892274, partial [Mycena olivaceomarginata]
MIKIGGWVISYEAAMAWFDRHPDIAQNIPRSRPIVIPIQIFVDKRNKSLDKMPFSITRDYFTHVMSPKTTPEEVGTDRCLLIGRIYRASTETWKKYDELEERPQDVARREAMVADGLELGQWLTVPDPWQDEWPFYVRHPGKRPAMQADLHLARIKNSVY